MRKVYVANFSGHDMTDAKKYGDLVLCTSGKDINIFNTDELIVDMHKALFEAAKSDFVLLSGSPVINIVLTAIMLSKFGAVHLLIFDAVSREYVARHMTKAQFEYVEEINGNK